MTIRVSIIGASGYGGGELARLLVGHPEVTLVHLGAESRQGETMADLYPNLRGLTSATTGPSDAERVARDSDVVFLALPADKAMGLAPAMLEHTRIVDLGADFRFKDPQVYEQWYRAPHRSPGLLDEAVYGLTEFRRSEIRRARVVGKPGCYPTAALLAILPLLQSERVSAAGVIIDAKSGISGSGRGLSMDTHFAEVNENVKPYGVAGHRHTPEIEQELAGAPGGPGAGALTPHPLPPTRRTLPAADPPPSRRLTNEEATAELGEA